MTSDDPKPHSGLLTGFFILLITGSVHLLGSAVLFGIISGPFAVVASPFLSLFGWFFVLPELVGVTVQWFVYDPRKGSRYFWQLLLTSVLIACPLMALIGPKEEGDGFRWTCAYVIATAVAVMWSMLAIRMAKRDVLSAEDLLISQRSEPVPRGLNSTAN
ncbi:MAG: hypothetical protein JXM70_05750 [Pirellulales bacterium]|nr:hypothetical protein [Pirellulales bacterium]